jgi:acyl-coenzyme A thioesterase PaaI-like protein
MWDRLAGFPGGRWLFNRLMGLMVPYTGALGSTVEELRPGFARVRLNERRGIRNHLNSIHAVALVNLGEFTSGLAMTTLLPPTIRGIVINLATDFTKKARGRLVAECTCRLSEIVQETDFQVVAVVKDDEGDIVSTTTATWRLAPLT